MLEILLVFIWGKLARIILHGNVRPYTIHPVALVSASVGARRRPLDGAADRATVL